MKNNLLLLSVFLVSLSCIDKNPKIDESKYIAMQQEYESEKSDLASVKTNFLSANKASINEKLLFFEKIKDSAYSSDQVLLDSTYYLSDTPVKLVNFPMSLKQRFVMSTTRTSRNTDDDTRQKAIFLARQGNEFAEKAFSEHYQEIYPCEDSLEGNLCSDLKMNDLKTFLDLKYAFVVDGYRITEPALEDSKNFTPGLFFAAVVVHDIEKNEALIRFNIAASNSEEVQYREGGYLDEDPLKKIQSDFEINIKKEIWAACQKHFDIGTSRY
ncbi:hypothetical protein [Spongiimicrobium salis]